MPGNTEKVEWVMAELSLLMNEWHDLSGTDPEIGATFGSLYFASGECVFTRNESLTARTVRDAAYLPAYPLALWIAESWWRLFHEPAPIGKSLGWALTHKMKNIGGGFVWPEITLVPDDVTVCIHSNQTRDRRFKQVRYLGGERKCVPLHDLETVFAKFVDIILERLGDITTPLHTLWDEVREERRSPALSLFRKIEARLGFDPDEVPESLIHNFIEFRSMAGEASLMEALTALRETSTVDLSDKYIKLESMVKKGIQGEFHLPEVSESSEAIVESLGEPWTVGRKMAERLRCALDAKDKIQNDTLLNLVGITTRDFQNKNNVPVIYPYSIGVRNDRHFYFNIIKDNIPGKRFQLARYISDYLYTKAGDLKNWLVLSSGRTYRQMVQRACAAELLCPIEQILEQTDNNYSDASIQNVAKYFDVSPLVVSSQLANHGHISTNDIPAYAM